MLPHRSKELHRPLCHLSLDVCTDHCTVGHLIGLNSLLLQLMKLQGPSWHCPCAYVTGTAQRTDHCRVGHLIGLDSQLLQPITSARAEHLTLVDHNGMEPADAYR